MLVWYEQDLLHPKAVTGLHPETVRGLAGLEIVAACCTPRLGLMKPLLAAAQIQRTEALLHFICGVE